MTAEKKDLPVIKEKEFLKEVDGLLKEISIKRVIKPSEVEKIKIETEDDFAIAMNSLNTIKDNIDFIENTRKSITDPINGFFKKIKEKFDSLNTPNEDSKTILSSKITSYKQVQRQAALAKERAEKEELEKKKESQIIELKRINRIEHNLYVRLFGGDTIKSDLTKEARRPCHDVQDVEIAIAGVEKNFPPIEEFSEDLRSDIIKVRELFFMVANNLKRAFFDSKSDNVQTREEALTKIMNLNNEYHTEVESRREERKADFAEEIKSTEKAISNEVKEVSKGFRRDIKWEVINLEAVNNRFKKLDDDVVKDFKTKNKDKILEYIKANKALEIIPGLKFYVEEKFIGSR
jgi:hypothetical protein